MDTKSKYIKINETESPSKFRTLLDRYNATAPDPALILLLETEALVEESRNREIREYQKKQEKSQEKNKKLHESLLNERNARIEAQRKQEEAQRNSIKTLLKYGIKPEEIATELNLPLDEVNRIIKTL
jgi:thymidylate kinase